MFKKVLIANRGEIAVRIIRACRELGIQTAAIYSDADRQGLHVRYADEAYRVGGPQSRDSYLRADRILEIARRHEVDAIHPGYGFLAERSDFAQACADAGIAFIGPNPSSIASMGDKAVARATVSAAGVPVVPGTEGEGALRDEELLALGPQIGFPLLIKATAGGGGKGMREVRSLDEMPALVAAARREAEAAFGDGNVYLEKLVEGARHIEIQILADHFGSTIYLGERECSLQRRHQKLVEEAPSPFVDEDLRRQMGAVAVRAAQAVGYANAGTIEFLVDKDRRFYFLEMNTRLQVEHPITEMISGLDLVQWQIRIAAGQALPFQQSDLRARGHAIECRLYAEDPAGGFLPATGQLLRFIEPKGPGVRVDTGVTSGDEITIHYDPMIAKLIVHAEDRPAAIRKMQAALRDTVLLGLTTNARFLQDVLDDAEFQAGQAHTTWVEPRFAGWQHPTCDLPPEALIAAALTQMQAGASPEASGQAAPGADPYSPWRQGSAFRLGEG
jgi:acetyl-CoA carboxylase biotin carboxylase subunit